MEVISLSFIQKIVWNCVPCEVTFQFLPHTFHYWTWIFEHLLALWKTFLLIRYVTKNNISSLNLSRKGYIPVFTQPSNMSSYYMTATLLSLYIHSILFCTTLGLRGDISSDLLVFTILKHTWCCKPEASSVSKEPIDSIYHADGKNGFLQNDRYSIFKQHYAQIGCQTPLLLFSMQCIWMN